MSFYIPGSMSISNINNNVGINTLNPQYTLDVVGNINVSGEIFNNGTIINGLPSGTNYGDYLLYNGTGWIVGSDTIAIGQNAGQTNQSQYSVALGYQAGNQSQGTGSVAIGNNAGQTNQGEFSIAIGNNAGVLNQYPNSIILNASGSQLNTTNPGFYVNPIQNFSSSNSYFLTYNTTTNEITKDPNFFVSSNTGYFVGNNIIPYTSNTYDLGTLNNRWNSIYLNTGSIYIGNVVLSSDNSDLIVNGTLSSNSYSGAIVYTSSLESISSELNIGTQDVNTINIGTSNQTQTINLGTVGAGQTIVNIGGPGDTVNIAGELVYVDSTVTEITNPYFIINAGNPNINNSGIIISKTGISGETTGAYILVNSTSDAWILQAGNGQIVTLNQNVSTTSSPTFNTINTNSINSTNINNSSALQTNTLNSTGTITSNTSLKTTNGSSIVDFTELSSDGTLSKYNAGGANAITYSFDGIEKMRISSTGNVGIGTSNPEYNLDVIGNIRCQTGGLIIPDSFNNFGPVNGSYIYRAGDRLALEQRNSGGGGGIVFRTNTGAGGIADRVTIIPNGNVGIGTSSPAYQLQLSRDDAAKPTSNTWTISSDKRVKENIINADIDICKLVIDDIPLRRYGYNTAIKEFSDNNINDVNVLGFIAEEFERYFPKGVTRTVRRLTVPKNFMFEDMTNIEEESIYIESIIDGNVIKIEDPNYKTIIIKDFQGLNSSQIIPTLVGAVKKQSILINDLVERIKRLESSVTPPQST